MWKGIRRFIGPTIAFLVATGIEVSGFENIAVAVGLWGFAGIWGIVTLLTWKPVRRLLRDVKRIRIVVAPNHNSVHSRATTVRMSDTNDSIAINNKDALEHVVIEERMHTRLVIHQGRAGWPVMYPIRIRNTRPVPVDIISYNVTILWNGAAIQRIAWRAPNRDADNGLAVHPPFDSPAPLEALRMQPDSAYQLEIPVNVVQVANRPAMPPYWTARGTIYFRCGSNTGEKQFNFHTDNYQLTPSEWAELQAHATIGDTK